MAKYTAVDFAKEVLEKVADAPLSAVEIWEKGRSLGFDKKLTSSGKAPYATFSAHLYVSANGARSPFVKIGKRPTKFWLKARDLIPVLPQEGEGGDTGQPEIPAYTEWELHPLLTYFAYSNVKFNKENPIYTKTIFHEKSIGGPPTEWMHPDIVGVYIPVDGWKDEVIELSRITASNPVTLYSFEMRKSITQKNCREYFFQALSTSSWANEGYLVAPDIKADVRDDLEQLSGRYGVGVIKLDLSNIDSSFVLYPAKRRHHLDWEAVNRLATTNDGFRNFIRNVKQTYDIKTFHEEDYDEILSPDDVVTYIKQHTMVPSLGKIPNIGVPGAAK